MSIMIPFNFCPSATTTQTGTYTIPSGKYGRVTVTDFGSNFSINGSIVIYACEYNSSASTASTGQVFSNAYPYKLIGTMSVNSGNTKRVIVSDTGTDTEANRNPYSGTVMTADQAESVDVFLNPGDQIYVTINDPGTVYWNLSAVDKPDNAVFWVKEDAELEGSRYFVELYDMIT